MKSSLILSGIFLLAFAYAGCQQHTTEKGHENNPYYSRTDTFRLNVKNAVWKKILPPELYAVAREQATQAAFTGKYWNKNPRGTYYCAVCGNKLFRSDAKFASTCGWPSFFEAARPNAVIYREDDSYGMNRTEVICVRCGSHLGHIFDDGPPPTLKRFCMNSVSLDFVPAIKSKRPGRCTFKHDCCLFYNSIWYKLFPIFQIQIFIQKRDLSYLFVYCK